MNLSRVPYIDLEPLTDFLDDDYDDYDYEDEGRRRRRRSPVDLGFDPSIDLYPGDYCNIIKDLTEDRCLENSLLELWSEDQYGQQTEEILETISQEEIIRAVNEDSFSKVLGFDQDFTKYLGGIERNSSGHIVAAKATFIRFFGKVNVSAITEDELSSASKGSPVDQFTLRWEGALIETLTAGLGDTGRFELFSNVAKSFSDLSAEAIEGDAFIFGCGTAIMFIYVQIMLGKFNFVEQRVSCHIDREGVEPRVIVALPARTVLRGSLLLFPRTSHQLRDLLRGRSGLQSDARHHSFPLRWNWDRRHVRDSGVS